MGCWLSVAGGTFGLFSAAMAAGAVADGGVDDCVYKLRLRLVSGLLLLGVTATAAAGGVDATSLLGVVIIWS